MSDQVIYVGTITLPANATWWSCVWGTVSVTNASAIVTGTNFTTNLAAGQSVSFANQGGTVYTIKTVDSSTQITLTANFTGATNAATAMGFSADPVYNVDGQARLRGYIFSSVAPSTIQFQLSQDGTNWDVPINLVLDGGSTTAYSFDINLVGQPFVRFNLTDAGAGSTARILFYTFDEGSGPTLVGGSPPSNAPTYVKDAVLTPLGFGQGTVDGTTAKDIATLTGAPIPAGTLYAQVCLDTGGTNVACRFRYDGTSPTATVGMILNAGVILPIETTPLSSFQIIGTSAGPTTVNISFFK